MRPTTNRILIFIAFLLFFIAGLFWALGVGTPEAREALECFGLAAYAAAALL